MKRTFTLLLSLTLLIFACKKDIEYKSEFETSRDAWVKARQSMGNNYVYVVIYGSVFGGSSETTITIINGTVTARAYKMYTYAPNSTVGVLQDSWTENKTAIGSRAAGAEALTMDQVYNKAKTVWLKADPKQNDIYFEAKNNGVISNCGFVPKGCQDDCFNGITIRSITGVVVN